MKAGITGRGRQELPEAEGQVLGLKVQRLVGEIVGATELIHCRGEGAFLIRGSAALKERSRSGGDSDGSLDRVRAELIIKTGNGPVGIGDRQDPRERLGRRIRDRDVVERDVLGRDVEVRGDTGQVGERGGRQIARGDVEVEEVVGQSIVEGRLLHGEGQQRAKPRVRFCAEKSSTWLVRS